MTKLLNLLFKILYFSLFILFTSTSTFASRGAELEREASLFLEQVLSQVKYYEVDERTGEIHLFANPEHNEQGFILVDGSKLDLTVFNKSKRILRHGFGKFKSPSGKIYFFQPYNIKFIHKDGTNEERFHSDYLVFRKDNLEYLIEQRQIPQNNTITHKDRELNADSSYFALDEETLNVSSSDLEVSVQNFDETLELRDKGYTIILIRHLKDNYSDKLGIWYKKAKRKITDACVRALSFKK